MAQERLMEVSFEKGGSVRVRLMCGTAPKTAEAIWNALPFDTTAKQARSAGEETYLETSHIIKGVESENLTEARFGSVQFATSPWNNITIYYGDMVKVPPFNEFGRVVEEDMDELAKIGNRIWAQGFERVVVRKLK